MKYFKMRESKRKISFIMALALIVSLLPVSPVVKAAEPNITVYVDNKVEGVKAEAEKTATDGAITVKVTPIEGTFTGNEDITISAKLGTSDSNSVTTYAAVATAAAIANPVVGARQLESGAFVWNVTDISNNVIITVDGTYNPSIISGPTKEPSKETTVTTPSAISDKMLNKLVGTTNLTQEEANEVKSGAASLKFVPKTNLVDMTSADKTAIESFLNNNTTIKNLVESFLKAENSFVFDLEIAVKFVKGGTEKDLGTVHDLGDVIEIIMEIPEACRNTNASKLRTYFVIRLHEEEGKETEVTRIDCETSGNNFSFKNDKFSKFILCYKDVNSSWNGGATVPPTGTTKPGTTTAPSASPSASASAAPGASTTAPAGTNKPDGSVDDGNNNPGVTEPGDGDTGDNEGNTSGSSSKVKKGQKYTVNGIKYEIISTDSTKTVGFVNGKKNSKKITIPATVKIKGKTFKVKSIKTGAFKNSKKLTTLVIGANVKVIEKNAFKGCKNLKKITIKSKKLTAAKVAKNAFKGINKKATVKVPKNKVKAYSKIIKVKGGAGNSVKVTK